MPEPSRRSMLLLGAGVAGAGIVGAVPGVAQAAVRFAPGGLRRSNFVPGVGSTFVAVSARARYRLELTEIADVPPGPDERAFNLLFRPTGRTEMPEGIYRLSAPAVPSSTLFVSPVRAGAEEVLMQALVNARA